MRTSSLPFVLGILVAVFMTAPVFIIVPMSFSTDASLQFPPPGYWTGYYSQFFASPGWVGPLVNSFVIGFIVTLVTMAFVTPAAIAMHRFRFAGRGAVNALLMLPLAVPHIVMAVGYYYYYAQLGLLQTYLGVTLAHTCLVTPLCFLMVSAGLKGLDPNVERAAVSLGAGPVRAFFLVTLPMLRPVFLTTSCLCFIYSFDETTIALFVSGRDVATLPKKMFDSVRMQADPLLSVASTLIFGAVLVVFVLALVMRGLAARRRRAQHSYFQEMEVPA